MAAFLSFPGVTLFDEEKSVLGTVIPGAGAGVPLKASTLGMELPSPDLMLGSSFLGWSTPFTDAGRFPFALGVEVPADLPTRFSSSLFKLCISCDRSSSLASPFAFQPSNALGTRSFNPWTWSAMILLSASRLEFAAFRSATTVSTSFSVVSSFSVRSASEAFRVAVSAANWSIRAKALLNDSSMAALSCSS